jgi:hypothetical protein
MTDTRQTKLVVHAPLLKRQQVVQIIQPKHQQVLPMSVEMAMELTAMKDQVLGLRAKITSLRMALPGMILRVSSTHVNGTLKATTARPMGTSTNMTDTRQTKLVVHAPLLKRQQVVQIIQPKLQLNLQTHIHLARIIQRLHQLI